MAKEKENMGIVITGHVDHGKSTLIGRLFFDTDSLPEGKIEELKKTCDALGRELEFGFLMDSLEEERDQAITIDTTQSFFKTSKRNYVIIDAPGHKEFLRNMITGASLADAAVLMVDAEEGIQEQTRRHAFILSMIGLKQIIVAVNKMDLVGYRQQRFEEVKSQLTAFLATIGIKPMFFVPISARQGDNVAKKSENMPWYNGLALLNCLDSFEIKRDKSKGPLRFPVQDVYHIDGKRIVVGKIESGTMRNGDSVIVQPPNIKTVVKSIEVFLKPDKKEAFAGESIGIITSEKVFVDRGQVICDKENPPKVKDEIIANVFWIAKKPVSMGERLVLKCATQEIGCCIKRITRRYDSSSLELIQENANELMETELGEVLVKTSSPIAFDLFAEMETTGRFVLEREYDTVANGIIMG